MYDPFTRSKKASGSILRYDGDSESERDGVIGREYDTVATAVVETEELNVRVKKYDAESVFVDAFREPVSVADVVPERISSEAVVDPCAVSVMLLLELSERETLSFCGVPEK
jgi:hypothetical protein